MIEALKRKLKENEQPIGIKKISSWKLPPRDFAYGYPVVPDKEGVSIITRHWKFHEKSGTSQPPQDFITINKLAIKMNATNFYTSKDYRSMIDIRRKPIEGKLNREIKLPPDDFAYGIQNRPSTPIKQVVNNDFGNKAEFLIKKEYNKFIKEKSKIFKGPPKIICRYINPKVFEMRQKEEEERKEKEREKNFDDSFNENVEKEPPLWKMKMFRDVGSKVAEDVKKFKTYKPWKKDEFGLDKMIKNVQEEIMQNEHKKNENEKIKESGN